MNELTESLLQKCKEAGYTAATVFVADKRCPTSVRVKKMACDEYWGRGTKEAPLRVICCSPEQRDGKFHHPEIWNIIKRMGLSSGAYDESVKVNQPLLLTAGFYDLTEI